MRDIVATGNRGEGDAAEAPEERTRVILALGTAFLALIVVVIVLVAFGRQTQALRMELADLVEPANAALFDLQRVLALQMAAQRGYRLGGAQGSLTSYRELLEEEQEIHRRLLPLAHAIGPEATSALAALRGAAARWHEDVERAEPTAPTDGLNTRLSTQEGYYAAALAEADRLGALIEQTAERRRSTISARQRIEDAMIVAMVVLAAVALAVVARVGRRLHAVGLEARRMAAIARSRHDELRGAAEEKASFIRGITHDLKNPLGVIDGSAELLEIGARGPLTEGQRDITGRIRRAAREMLRIINDLLELSRAETAALTLQRQQVEVNALVESVVEDYRATLESSRHTVVVERAPEDTRITTDPTRVREIVGNLLTNTARHIPENGRVEVTVARATGDGPREGAVTISVSDNGPGVPPGIRERIFREFARGHGSDGSGIGLAIGRKLARALGGDLVLRDTPGDGATFTLLLPESSSTALPAPRTPDTGSR